MIPLHQIRQLLNETYKQWRQDKAAHLAAALAYYTLFSLPPLLVLIIDIAGAFLGADAARGQLVAQLQEFIGREGAQTIEALIAGISSHQQTQGYVASAVSLGILFFGATAVFIELQDALNSIWKVAPRPRHFLLTFFLQRAFSFAIILILISIMFVSLLVSAALLAVDNVLGNYIAGFSLLWTLVDFAISLTMLWGIFAALFKFLPNANISWQDVALGAALTALLFNVGKYLIGFYLSVATFKTTYGAAGSLVVLLTWIYYSAQIIFLGAEFTHAYSQQLGSQRLENLDNEPHKHSTKISKFILETHKSERNRD